VGVAAVILDLDGVLVDSERVWSAARAEVAERHGGRIGPAEVRAMQGMSSTEWSTHMHDALGVDLPPPAISDAVVELVQAEYRRRVPLLPGARKSVLRLAGRWPLGLASSANRPIIDLVLELTGLRASFAATVSSEEVARGKPAPDVYLRAAGALAEPAERCVAVEDSTNGLLSAAAAGMIVVAVPNAEFPPAADALARAALVLRSLDELRPSRVERLGGDGAPPVSRAARRAGP
jgi:HAD superfamily hydrolase (TIGR01509 family)